MNPQNFLIIDEDIIKSSRKWDLLVFYRDWRHYQISHIYFSHTSNLKILTLPSIISILFGCNLFGMIANIYPNILTTLMMSLINLHHNTFVQHIWTTWYKQSLSRSIGQCRHQSILFLIKINVTRNQNDIMCFTPNKLRKCFLVCRVRYTSYNTLCTS